VLMALRAARAMMRILAIGQKQTNNASGLHPH